MSHNLKQLEGRETFDTKVPSQEPGNRLRNKIPCKAQEAKWPAREAPAGTKATIELQRSPSAALNSPLTTILATGCVVGVSLQKLCQLIWHNTNHLCLLSWMWTFTHSRAWDMPWLPPVWRRAPSILISPSFVHFPRNWLLHHYYSPPEILFQKCKAKGLG